MFIKVSNGNLFSEETDLSEITIVPTMANNKINPVIINQIEWLVYIMLPMLEISELFTSAPSHL